MKTTFTRENALINLYIANLAAYNAGYLVGEWLSLPASDETLNELFKAIKFENEDTEYAIHDYECFVSGISIDEYASIKKLNEVAEELEGLDDYDLKKIEAYIEAYGGNFAEALEEINNYTFIEGVTLEEYAEELVDECYNLDEFAKRYFDYAAFARDLNFEGYTETENGVIYR